MTKLKFEHTTCKENLRKETPFKDLITSKFVIYLVVLVLVYLFALLLFYINPLFDFGLFGFFVAVGSWSLFYTVSQDIINQNLFAQFFSLSFIIILFSGILILLTESSFYNFIITGYPLLYILFFRLLLLLFYKDFATTYTKPTILFASRYSKWTHENADRSYIVTKKELLFSNLLFFGTPAIAGLIAYFIIV
ncbi:hypothetical protein [Flavobacterium quisquiliarum]|uniref:DUF3899 domain-containing protein n=1 Tax=Flavobacterium quisquiliarum TaxID=1834436 RepID=A0ABV8WBG5_9FLAO|nr:hypothetical protein [Flavobacterium quisquiliarum]MBW1657932.1 hypothetical protein [Flavobacterium quisquiliarum]